MRPFEALNSTAEDPSLDEAPILHVNGDDPEAVLYVTQLALDFRQRFKKDVVIDLVCFRRLGHNEQDEPAITQPLMYKRIMQHEGTRKLYAQKLATLGVVTAEQADELINRYRADLDAGKRSVNPVISNFKSKFAVDWAPYLNTKWTDAADTHVPLAELLSPTYTDERRRLVGADASFALRPGSPGAAFRAPRPPPPPRRKPPSRARPPRPAPARPLPVPPAARSIRRNAPPAISSSATAPPPSAPGSPPSPRPAPPPIRRPASPSARPARQ